MTPAEAAAEIRNWQKTVLLMALLATDPSEDVSEDYLDNLVTDCNRSIRGNRGDVVVTNEDKKLIVEATLRRGIAIIEYGSEELC